MPRALGLRDGGLLASGAGAIDRAIFMEEGEWFEETEGEGLEDDDPL